MFNSVLGILQNFVLNNTTSKRQTLTNPFIVSDDAIGNNQSGDNSGNHSNDSIQPSLNQPGSSTAAKKPTVISTTITSAPAQKQQAITPLTHCKTCSMEKSQVATGDKLWEVCTRCGSFWCMVHDCDHQCGFKHNMTAHLRKKHNENRRMTDFNVISGHSCQCNGDNNIIYTTDGTIGQCRKCWQKWCLIAGCNREFPNLVDCVAHQYRSHSQAQREPGTLGPPAICGNCGWNRSASNLVPNNVRITRKSCPNCPNCWCAVGDCGYESLEYRSFVGHVSSVHGFR